MILSTPLPQIELALLGEDEVFGRRFRDLARLLGVKIEEPARRPTKVEIARAWMRKKLAPRKER